LVELLQVLTKHKLVQEEEEEEEELWKFKYFTMQKYNLPKKKKKKSSQKETQKKKILQKIIL
jgi:hypothetical protein